MAVGGRSVCDLRNRAAGHGVRSRPGPHRGRCDDLDTGINPYHVTFRDPSPRAQQHPSTYIPGYPADAEALPITLTEPDYARAVRRDCETIWKNVKPGRLYWFPGTKIVGAFFAAEITARTALHDVFND
jgi:hypothetical protein